jgi:hypothetical protein
VQVEVATEMIGIFDVCEVCKGERSDRLVMLFGIVFEESEVSLVVTEAYRRIHSTVVSA